MLLLLWDYWPLRRIGAPSLARQRPQGSMPRMSVGWLVLEKIPLLLLSAASAVVTMKAQQAGGAIQAFSQYNLPLRLETALIAYVRYLGKAIWPAKLVALYPHSRHALSGMACGRGGAVVAGHHCSGAPRSRSPLSCGRMVLFLAVWCR